MTSEIRRPVIRYHGGKYRIAPWVISHFPEHRVYVEPFGGAGSVLMRKRPSRTEVYNDLDREIVNAFLMIRERPAELEALLRATPYAREEFELSYTPSDNPLEQARRTIVRAYFGHGSSSVAGHITGFRSKTHSQHAGGSREWKTYPDQIRLFADRLSGVIIENLDAFKLIDVHDGPETLFTSIRHICLN